VGDRQVGVRRGGRLSKIESPSYLKCLYACKTTSKRVHLPRILSRAHDIDVGVGKVATRHAGNSSVSENKWT
jgi:hypothetical protein